VRAVIQHHKQRKRTERSVHEMVRCVVVQYHICSDHEHAQPPVEELRECTRVGHEVRDAQRDVREPVIRKDYGGRGRGERKEGEGGSENEERHTTERLRST
jgi:hypothetical protein